jgi:hypothetical protein
MANFRKGTDAAVEASKMGGGSKFSKLEFFSIKDAKDPRRVVRFVTDCDDWITTTMHPSQPTRPAPANFKGKWPARMGAVCRMDSNHGERTFPEHADCFHCLTPLPDGKPRAKNERTWALGILRTQEVNDQGNLVWVDQTKDFTTTKDGVETTEKVPAFVVFCMAYSNFWTTLEDQYKMRGTVLDRDFWITRKGFTMNDTDYGIVGNDPLYIDYGDGRGSVVYDFRDETLRAFYDIPDLGEYVANQASDDYYDRFFDTRHPQPSFGNDDEKSTNVTTPATEPSAADVKTIADRLSGGAQGYGPNAGATATVAAAPAAPAAAAVPGSATAVLPGTAAAPKS